MRLSVLAVTQLYRSIEKGSLRLAVFNLVGGAVITTGLVVNAWVNKPYPTAIGVALALLIGGSLTSVTVWASLTFGRAGQPDDPRGERHRHRDSSEP